MNLFFTSSLFLFLLSMVRSRVFIKFLFEVPVGDAIVADREEEEERRKELVLDSSGLAEVRKLLDSSAAFSLAANLEANGIRERERESTD